ncbi:hypothetical protein ACFOEK_04645 [Litoribrevibacter euphylliae]|uniref:Uncharacterized protein n=1 Tax=Litoribrevibacter euphylliae TaxID=1834034 RepID=A0ABV7H8R3_9GAMM
MFLSKSEVFQDFETGLKNSTINTEILRNASQREIDKSRSLKSVLGVFLLLFLRLMKGKSSKQSYEEVGFHWSNHSIDYNSSQVLNLNYQTPLEFSRNYHLLSVLKLMSVLYGGLLFSNKFRKYGISRGEALLFSFEYAFIYDVLVNHNVSLAFSFGTFCRRMQFIGVICKRNNIEHEVYQHGALRKLDGIKRTYITKFHMKFSEKSEILNSYFIGYKGDDDYVVSTLNREPKFKQTPGRISDSIYFATNPNHLEINLSLVKLLVDNFPHLTVYVSPHPREDFSEYLDLYPGNSNYIVTGDKFKGCSLYIFRPSSIIVEASEEEIPFVVYLSEKDRYEHYMEGVSLGVLKGLDGIELFVRDFFYG